MTVFTQGHVDTRVTTSNAPEPSQRSRRSPSTARMTETPQVDFEKLFDTWKHSREDLVSWSYTSFLLDSTMSAPELSELHRILDRHKAIQYCLRKANAMIPRVFLRKEYSQWSSPHINGMLESFENALWAFYYLHDAAKTQLEDRLLHVLHGLGLPAAHWSPPHAFSKLYSPLGLDECRICSEIAILYALLSEPDWEADMCRNERAKKQVKRGLEETHLRALADVALALRQQQKCAACPFVKFRHSQQKTVRSYYDSEQSTHLSEPHITFGGNGFPKSNLRRGL